MLVVFAPLKRDRLCLFGFKNKRWILYSYKKPTEQKKLKTIGSVSGKALFFAHGSNHSCGVLVFVRDSLEFEMKSIITNDNGRYILLNAKVQGSDYILGNIYAPNKIKEQCNFFVELQQKLDDFITIQDQRIIIGGDFNVIMDQNLDCAGGSPKEKESVKFLNDICLNYDLIDIWRTRNPDSTLFTWR